MPEITADNLLLIALFLAPGYITIKAYSLLMGASALREFNFMIFESCIIGLFNFALWYWMLDIRPDNIGLRIFFILWIAIGAPVIYAILYRYIRTRSFTLKWLAHPSPTSWDFVFGKRKSYRVIAHLKEGQRVAGFFGGESFASTGPGPRDLYLQQACTIDEEGNLGDPIPDHQGILIKVDDCIALEFFVAGGRK
jgi:hypothetical protein